LSAEN